MSNTIMPTYNRLPVEFVRGEGCWLMANDGRKYLDCLSGISVCGLGHAHPAIASAISRQARTLVHTSNLYQIKNQQLLADRLCALAGMDNVFFANSGAEANEAAIKIARKYAYQQNIDNPAIIVADKSFHGRTIATLSASGNKAIQQGFGPLVTGFVQVPYDDVVAIEQQLATNPNIVAVLLEPAQGEGGVNIPHKDYLKQIRKLCDEHKALMMLDEVQTGMCRTGKMFAHQHNGITPDVMTLAKGLANGVPIGACLAHNEASKILGAGNHGSTFGGNPLAAAAALATLEVLEQGNVCAQVEQKAEFAMQKIKQNLSGNPGIKNIRNFGLLIGIELERECTTLPLEALEKKILINVTAGNVVRLLPPLIMSEDEINIMASQTCELILDFLA